MKVGLIVIFCLYLFKLFQNRSKEKREYEEAEQEIFKKVEQILGNNDLRRLKSKNIWIGMPQCLIYYSLGKPHDISNSQDIDNVYHIFYYGPKPYQYGGETKYKYKTEIKFHNHFLTNIN